LSVGPALANLGYLAAAAPARRRLERALRRPEVAQREILWRIIRASSSTSFGREHGFSEIRSLSDWRDRVPLRDFEAFRPYVERIAEGEPNVLTSDAVTFMEPTGGSSGVEKLVPYTKSLLAEFSAATLPWVFDLLSRRPRVRAGRAYWAVSPPMRRAARTDGGLPIGANDSDYFPAIARWLLGQTMVVPAGAQLDVESWRHATLRTLLGASDLALISVWSPSFLTLLAEALDDSFPRLVGESHVLRKRFGSRAPQDLGELWPQLDIISCWTDGSAASSLGPMRERFPRVEVQGKGLLATEGVVSFPLFGLAAPVAAVTSHFLEFVDASGQVRMAHELSNGGQYEVLLTTGGGFQRYRLRDLVEVAGHIHATPLLRFGGRSDGASDLAGEKLTPALVQAVIERAARELSLQSRFAMLAPLTGDPPGYALFAELDDPGCCSELGARVEALLLEAHHYRLCRQLGQLAPVRAIAITGGALRYEQVCVEAGQRPGSIKPPSLDASAEHGRKLAETLSVVR
jgi:GH3 auxin-responsive promoter